jgi:hypothetical protein
MDNNEEMLASYLDAAPDIPEEIEDVVKEEDPKVEDDTKKEDDDTKKEEDISGGIDSEGKKEESGEDVVKRVKADLGIEKKEDEEKGSAIPAEFTKVCLAQGWSEEDIKDFTAGIDNDVLLEMIPEIIGDGDLEKKAESKGSEKKSEGKPKTTDSKTIDDATKTELAALKKEIEALKEEGKEKKVKDAQSQEAAMIVTVNQTFDKASEDFKIFGKTEELLRYPAGPKKGQVVMGTGAMVAREEVWKKAVPFIKSGVAIDEAMKIALTWYKGENLEKDVHRGVIKELKRNEQKLSAKRTSKKTVKVYKDDDARKDAVVREAARKAGVKGNYGD